jgi:hypothetical protein
LDILIAGIFGEEPQADVGGCCRVHAGVWGRAVTVRLIERGGADVCSRGSDLWRGECLAPVAEWGGRERSAINGGEEKGVSEK